MIERNGGYAAGVFHFVYLFYISPDTMPGVVEEQKQERRRLGCLAWPAALWVVGLVSLRFPREPPSGWWVASSTALPHTAA